MEKQPRKSRASERRRARRKAVQALYQLHYNPVDAEALETQFMQEPDMLKADIAYFRKLVRGVEAHRKELDDVVAPQLSRPLDEVDPVELAILRLAAFELRFNLDVPYRVVINEAVELAKKFGAEDGHKFVNGALDRMAAELREVEVKAKRR